MRMHDMYSIFCLFDYDFYPILQCTKMLMLPQILEPYCYINSPQTEFLHWNPDFVKENSLELLSALEHSGKWCRVNLIVSSVLCSLTNLIEMNKSWWQYIIHSNYINLFYQKLRQSLYIFGSESIKSSN